MKLTNIKQIKRGIYGLLQFARSFADEKYCFCSFQDLCINYCIASVAVRLIIADQTKKFAGLGIKTGNNADHSTSNQNTKKVPSRFLRIVY